MGAFEHIDLVNKSIRELYRALGYRQVAYYKNDFIFDHKAKDFWSDPIIGTQQLAKLIAGHYRLNLTTVIVTFRSVLKVPGRVELSNSNEFFVELQSQQRNAPKAIAAILAHEIAHIYLHRLGISFPVEFENEVLTDTTAVYFGFGPTILNATTTNIRFRSDMTEETQTSYFGYLTLEEFGYIVAKRDFALGRDSSSKIDTGSALTGFLSGRARVKSELTSRPFVARPWRQRLGHAIFDRKTSSRTGIEPFVFSCPFCSQGLRVPKAFMKLSVHCSNCDSRFICYS
jgi:hypothetical protein